MTGMPTLSLMFHWLKEWLGPPMLPSSRVGVLTVQLLDRTNTVNLFNRGSVVNPFNRTAKVNMFDRTITVQTERRGLTVKVI